MKVENFLMMAVITLEVIHALARHGIGYVGCYPVGKHLQDIFENDILTGSVDDCVAHCRSYKLAAISNQTCYCSHGLADDVPLSSHVSCNFSCHWNAQQACGSKYYYAVYRTGDRLCSTLMAPPNGEITHSLFVVGRSVTFSCFPGFRLNGSTSIHCMESANGSSKQPVWSGDRPLCVQAITSTSSVTMTITTESCLSSCPPKTSDSFRFFIDFTVIIGLTSFVILLFHAYTRYRKSRSGHGISGMSEAQSNSPPNTSTPGIVYQSVIVNTLHQNVQAPRTDDCRPSFSNPPTYSSMDRHDSSNDTTKSSILEDRTSCPAPSTNDDCVQQPESDIDTHETINVDTDGYVPMDRISRSSISVELGEKMENRISIPPRVNYENRDVWRKRDRKSYLDKIFSPQ